MIDLLAGRPGELLALTLLHFLWQGLLVAVSVKVCEPLMRSVHSRYAASFSALVVMLALPVATYALLAHGELRLAMSEASPAEPPSQSVADALQLASEPAISSWQPLFVGAWLMGVLTLAARLLLGYFATLWLRGDRRQLPAPLAAKVAWLGRRLGVATRCRVFLSARVSEAIAVGCFKPLVLIPLCWASELPPSALEAVIAHELAHIRRWDLWATLLQRLAETLLFYHPAVWWLSRRLSQQRELCCDALAVSATQQPAEYVLALETIARRTSAPPLTLATAFLGGGKMNLLDRVRHVLAGGQREASAWWPAGLAALAAPLLAAAALSGWSLLPATVLADDDRQTPVEAEVRDESDEEAGLAELALRILTASEEGDGPAPPDEAPEADGDEAVGGLIDVVVRFLSVAEEAEEGVAADDESEGNESEEAALARKREAVRRRELQAEKETLDEELARLRKREETAKKKQPREVREELDLSSFKPETEREARLLAVIKKLQAQVEKRGNAPGKRAKKGSGPESKDPKIVSEYDELKKVFNKKLKPEEAADKRDSDDEAVKEKQRKAWYEYKEALGDDLKRFKATEVEGYALKLKDPDNISAKELDERKLRERDARSKKEALSRKQKEEEARAEKDAHRKQKEQWSVELPETAAEVEQLRRALKEREAQLQKAHQALERSHREALERERVRKSSPKKKAPGPKKGDDPYSSPNTKEEDGSYNPYGKDEEAEKLGEQGKSFDDYLRLRLDGIEFVSPEGEEAKRQ